MAKASFGCGAGADGATAVRRVGVDPGSCVATARIAAGDRVFPLATRDRVVRDEDISFSLDSQYSLSRLIFFSLLARQNSNASEGDSCFKMFPRPCLVLLDSL